MVYRFFNKTSTYVKSTVSWSHLLQNLKKTRVYLSFEGKLNKGFWFLLCFIDFYSKYV